MAVITISRELGSLGTYIARQTAHTLGCPLVDKGMIEKMLQVVKERQPIKVGGEELLQKWDINGGEMVYLYDRVIQAAARWGDQVMLGRGSFAILTRYPDVLNVRIQAPFELRVQRVLAKEHLSHQADVETLVRESDRVRSQFIQNWYGVQWEAASSFDLVIDTSKIPTDVAVSWLVEGFQVIKDFSEPDLITTRNIEVDEGIQQVVAELLDQQLELAH
jgi:cytidylate kinase